MELNKRHNNIEDVFFKMSHFLSASKGVDGICNDVANLVTSSLNFKRCVFIMKGEHEKFNIAAISGMNRDKTLESIYVRCTEDSTSFLRQVLLNKNTVAVDSLPQDLGIPRIRANAIVSPIICNAEGTGVLIAEADNINENDVQLIDSIARYVSLGIENNILHRGKMETRVELVYEIETLQLMCEIGKEILSNLKTEEIVETATQMIRRVIPCDGAAIALFDAGREVFHITASWGTGINNDTEIRKDDSPFYTVLENRRSFYQHDITLDFTKYPKLLEWAGEKNVFSYFCVPLSGKNKLFGILILSSVRSAWFTKVHITTAERIAAQVGAALENARLLEDIEEILLGAVKSLVSAIDAKSTWTKGHSLRVADYAMKLGEKLGFTKTVLERLQLAAILHDIGKIGTYEDILDKPGRLTQEEIEMIHRHPSQGADILSPLRAMRDVIPIIKHHHERYDGTGYPDGLAGDDIPLEARILALADVYDAIRSGRSYRNGLTYSAAVEELKKGAGAQFDPMLVKLFLEVLSREQM